MFLNFIFYASIGYSQSVTLSYYNSNALITCGASNWCSVNTTLCGIESKKFRIYFQHPGSLSGTCNSGNPNNYKFSISFYRDGVQIAPTTTANGTYGYYPAPGLDNITTTPGSYYAEVLFKKKKCISQTWEIVGVYRSNTIIFSPQPATPNFSIKTVLASETNVQTVSFTNGEIIELNTFGTFCESKYYIGVWETGTNWWERTYNYEWGNWFNGNTPGIINLQNLATNCGNYSLFTGPNARKNQILFGGQINAVSPPPNSNILLPYQNGLIGQPRRYTIGLATAEPTWKMKQIQIVIN